MWLTKMIFTVDKFPYKFYGKYNNYMKVLSNINRLLFYNILSRNKNELLNLNCEDILFISFLIFISIIKKLCNM